MKYTVDCLLNKTMTIIVRHYNSNKWLLRSSHLFFLSAYQRLQPRLNLKESEPFYFIPVASIDPCVLAQGHPAGKKSMISAAHGSCLSFLYPLGAFRHKQDSTLVAEQATIFSTSGFLRVNI